MLCAITVHLQDYLSALWSFRVLLTYTKYGHVNCDWEKHSDCSHETNVCLNKHTGPASSVGMHMAISTHYWIFYIYIHIDVSSALLLTEWLQVDIIKTQQVHCTSTVRKKTKPSWIHCDSKHWIYVPITHKTYILVYEQCSNDQYSRLWLTGGYIAVHVLN